MVLLNVFRPAVVPSITEHEVVRTNDPAVVITMSLRYPASKQLLGRSQWRALCNLIAHLGTICLRRPILDVGAMGLISVNI